MVREAFVSYNRNNGRPRGFGFVVFESMDVADKVVSTKHTIDRREVRLRSAHKNNTHTHTPTSKLPVLLALCPVLPTAHMCF